VALAAAAALFSWAMAKHVADIVHHREGLDFHDYYFSAASIRHGKSIYDHGAMVALAHEEVGTSGLPVLVYPPLLSALFVPLTFLPYATARIVWLASNEVLLAAAIAACARICAERGARRPGRLFCATFFLLAAAAFEPAIDHDWQGQSNTLVMALSAWALHEHLKRRPSDVGTGALLAPAFLLKLFPGIFVPYLVLRGRWRAAVWTAAASVAITLLSLVAVRWADYLRFPHVLGDSMYLKEGGGTLLNYSIPATAWWLGSLAGAPEGAARLAGNVLRYLPYPLALAAAAWEARGEASLQAIARMVPALRLSQAFLLMAFLILKWWEHHLVFALVPILFAVRLVFFERAAVRAPPVLAALLVVSGLWIALPRHPLMWEALQAPQWAGLRDGLVETKRFGILLLVAVTEVLIWRLKRLAPGAGPDAGRSAST
jgi:hypothetical protein